MSLIASKNISSQAFKHVQADPEVAVEDIDCCSSEAFNHIAKLQDHGVNAADIAKLKGHGITTTLGVLQTTRKELCSIKGFSEARVEKIVEAARQVEGGQTFLTGAQVMAKRETIVKITSGSSNLDTLLGQGFETSAITEVFGENRTGKTQICHTLCVTAQLPLELSGGNGRVCYIDTEGTFRPEKIATIADRFGVDGASVLDNIMYARAHTHEHMNHLLTAAAAKMTEEHFSLLIIDSIMALFRVDFSGRGELSERQQVLGKFMNKLMKVAEQFNLAVVLTNQVMSDPAGGLTIGVAPPKPVGGHVLGHASTNRLYVRKGKGSERIMKVYDSPNLPEAEAVYQLSDRGIIDPSD